ncbi:prephenate dehydratase [Oligoflexia bacterium]|nr:prephenate dehydratase [Oligoflexia bacterium]
MDLEIIRKRIDAIDNEVLSLLNKRMELAVRTKAIKTDINDSGRESSVLESVKFKSQNLLLQHSAEHLFSEIIKESKKLQGMDFNLIGFQGEHGAHSEIAAAKLDTQAVTIPHGEFADVFEGVQSGVIERGIVPVENSLAGNVSQVDDLLLESDLHIIAEIKLPIHHCLIALPDTDYRTIRAVCSHPQALSQCRGFISRNKLEPQPYYDTAGAAMMLATERPAATAVIASELCAKLYDLEILKDNIEDDSSNYTRFVVISKTPIDNGGNKCSIIFSATHKPGSLFQVLSAFSEAKINLTRIESRPLPKSPGMYGFLLDFLGSTKDAKIQEALKRAQDNSEMYKFLGCYEAAEKA